MKSLRVLKLTGVLSAALMVLAGPASASGKTLLPADLVSGSCAELADEAPAAACCLLLERQRYQ